MSELFNNDKYGQRLNWHICNSFYVAVFFLCWFILHSYVMVRYNRTEYNRTEKRWMTRLKKCISYKHKNILHDVLKKLMKLVIMLLISGNIFTIANILINLPLFIFIASINSFYHLFSLIYLTCWTFNTLMLNHQKYYTA